MLSCKRRVSRFLAENGENLNRQSKSNFGDAIYEYSWVLARSYVLFWRMCHRYRNGSAAVDRFSRRVIAGKPAPIWARGGRGYTRVRSWYNRERRSTKKIDGRDFIASYHGNIGGMRKMTGQNRGTKRGRSRLPVVEVRNVITRDVREYILHLANCLQICF